MNTYPRGPQGLPVLGNAVDFSSKPLELLEDSYRQFGEVFTLWLAQTPMIFLVGPKANKFVLKDNAHNLLWRGGFEPLIQLLGNGLLVSDGALHKQQRNIMAPALHPKHIGSYTNIMIEKALAMVSAWEEGATIDVVEEIRKCTLEIVTAALFSFSLGTNAQEFVRNLDILFASASPTIAARLIRIPIPGTIYAQSLPAKQYVDDIIYDQITKRKRSAQRYNDVLAKLLEFRDEDGQPLDDTLIRDQLIMLIVAGHDTTTSCLASTLYLLCQNEDAYKCVDDEIRQQVSSKAPLAEVLHQLDQTTRAINETLRLYPPAWIGSRVTAAPCEFAGFQIPAHTYIAYSNWLTQRDPKTFPDPLRFSPERFSATNQPLIPQFAFTPFGGGERFCLGASFAMTEMKVMLTIILSTFGLLTPPNQKIEYHLFPTLKPKSVQVTLTKQHSRARSSVFV